MNIIIRILLLIGLFSSTLELTFGQTTLSIQEATSDVTNIGSDDVILVTGGTDVYVDLSTAASSGRTVWLINHSSDDLLLSDSVKCSENIWIHFVGKYPMIWESDASPNRLQIIYDGTIWRLLSY